MLHRFLIFVLSLSLSVIGQHAHASAAVGQMVICSGSETTVVYMDAQGQPTRAPHHCPDCIVTFGNLPPDLQVPQPGATTRPRQTDFVRHVSERRAQRSNARAPPVLF